MQNMKTVLVAASMGWEGLAVLERREDITVVSYNPALPPAELHALLRDASAIALSYTRLDQAAIAAAPVCRWRRGSALASMQWMCRRSPRGAFR